MKCLRKDGVSLLRITDYGIVKQARINMYNVDGCSFLKEGWISTKRDNSVQFFHQLKDLRPVHYRLIRRLLRSNYYPDAINFGGRKDDAGRTHPTVIAIYFLKPRPIVRTKTRKKMYFSRIPMPDDILREMNKLISKESL